MLKMGGRKPLVAPERILEELLKHNIFDGESLKGKSNDIWRQIATAFENVIKPSSIYFHVAKDEHNSQTHYRKIKGLETRDLKNKSVPSQCVDVSENEESDEDIQPNKKRFKKSNVLNFEIELTSEEWNSICPQMKTKKDGTEAEYLQKGWTDIMRDKIYEKEKLPCSFSFSTNQINLGTFYAEMKGKCTSENCKSKVTVICKDIPEKDKPVLFEVETNDTKKIPHLKKVRLQGKAREIVKKELENIKPKQWRRHRARLMNFGDPEPANLFTLPVLQKAKQQQKNEKLGIPVGISLFESIENLTNSVELNPHIKNVGFNKFYIMYWTRQQIDLNNEILKKLNNPFTLDATSSFAYKVKRSDTSPESPALFLTVLCTHINNLIVPVSCLISEANDANFLAYWLQCFRQSGAKTPNEMVTDMGNAIRNALCLAYNNVTFIMYNDLCLLHLLGHPLQINLPMQMRTDVAHLIHAVTQWPCIKNCSETRISKLYKHSIGFMTEIYKFTDFIQFLRNIFILSSSLMDGDMCKKALEFVVQRIETFKFDELNNSYSAYRLKNHEEYNKKNSTNPKKNITLRLTTDFISKIQTDISQLLAKEKNEFSQKNDYHMPEFTEKLSKLCREFPCWTMVMNEHFNNPLSPASSARSEAYFSDFKSGIDGESRVDKVLVDHCRAIEADCNLAKHAIQNLYDVDAWRNKACKIEREIPLDEEENKPTHVPSYDKNLDSLFATDFYDNIPIAKMTDDLDGAAEKKIEIFNTLEQPDNSIIEKKIKSIVSDHSYSSFKSDVLDASSFIQTVDKKTKPIKNQLKPRGQHVTPCTDLNFLLIEVDTAYQDSSYAKSIGKDTSAVYTKVEDIPENITVNDINFMLAGVIRYTPPHSVGGLGHYTAYCRKNNGNWDYRDDQHQRKKEKCSIKTDIKISSILYVRNKKTNVN